MPIDNHLSFADEFQIGFADLAWLRFEMIKGRQGLEAILAT